MVQAALKEFRRVGQVGGSISASYEEVALEDKREEMLGERGWPVKLADEYAEFCAYGRIL